MDAKTKRFLAGLDAVKLRELRDHASAKLASGVFKPNLRRDGLAAAIVEVICEFTNAKQIDLTRPPSLMGKAAQYREFRRKLDVEGLSTWLYNAAGKNQITMRGLVHLSVELLHDRLIEMGIPVSATTIMNHMHRVPAVLNQSFPGYAQSGLLHLVIREHHKDERRERSDEPLPRREGTPTRKPNLAYNAGRGSRRR